MTQEQIHILELLSSEDNASVNLGLELLKSQNITIPILEKFKKSISFLGRKIENEALKYCISFRDRVYNHDEYKHLVTKDIFDGAINCTDEDINLNILTMDEDLYNDEIFEEIGNQNYLKENYFVTFYKEEHA